ncbi:hypothetical protein [Caenimonas aquaedulcis]|uniref:Uncharacterized protein n=1 Tax=Caenimonas aquaedulcis TaxID=2793270 RepID=A0A931H4J4_9BURK|nr:hypothetical protein [Caenimonas aquaedulcis]MBG9388436.1 hypothetical protein [Caenimonas aquaedulcis]
MPLLYLDFDFSDEESGRGSFDAMASVLPERLPALLAEISEVLRWAVRSFGAAAAEADQGEWDFELQGVAEPDDALDVSFDAQRGTVELSPGPGSARVTLTLTLGGSPAFCDAFREAFAVG